MPCHIPAAVVQRSEFISEKNYQVKGGGKIRI